MNARTITRLAWLLWLLCLVFGILAAVMPTRDYPLVAIALVGLWLEMTSAVGALIASRRPQNPIGWIMLAIGLILLGGSFARQYATYALVLHPGLLPMGQPLAWVSSWLPIPGFALLALLLLLFPTGRLPSRRWRWVVGGGIGGTAVIVIATAFRAGPIMGLGGEVPNPLGLKGVTVLLTPVADAAVALTAACGLAAIAAPFWRMHRATGDERQQIKWFALSAAFAAIPWVAGPLFFELISNPFLDAWLGFLVPVAGLSAMPVAIGIAILRYRLYDIDVIINRALVYGALTAVLALVYIAGVVGVGGVVRDVTGQEDNNLVVAGTTLSVAAIFRPARSRIQRFIDRRFYRRKYDAAKVIEGFSARLREQVDLETLNTELLDVVSETMQPAHVSLWLMGPEASS